MSHLPTSRWFLMLCSCMMLLAAPASVQAENWAFHRSYFTHELTPEVAAITPTPYYRSAYRTPTKLNYPGLTVRSTYRINRLHMQSGNNRDSQYLFEGTVEFRP